MLSNRVRSYFRTRSHDPKTEVLVSRIAAVDFIITASEFEALLLENNLIKKHRPMFNINMMDSRRFAYLVLTDEPYPRLGLARVHAGDGKFYGPFVSAVDRDYILSLLTRTFFIRTCRKLPKRACLRFHIGLCPAPCEGRIGEEVYAENMHKVEEILKGRIAGLANSLKQDMKRASERMDYERAIVLREQLRAIEQLKEHQNVERNKRYDEDVINYRISDNKVYLLLFNVYRGTLENKQQFEFEQTPEFLDEFVLQYYSENRVPKELIVPGPLDPSLKALLAQRRGTTVRVNVPKKGEKKQLLELVAKNIEMTALAHRIKLEDLRTNLDLQKTPEIIECFDISHISGTATTAAMVRFRSGIPDKGSYRRFRIRTAEAMDDYAAIAEVVRRRYSRVIAEHIDLPDLIVIDGGAGQLNSALSELNALGLKIPVIAIAKRFEEIHIPGTISPLRLDRKTPALKLLQNIRNEAHRFAIKYHRVLRKMELKEIE